MKKILFFLACAACGLSLSAQQDVVKEAEKAMKSGKSYKEVFTLIQPAMNNPETSNDVKTYYIPGKAGFKQYDDLLGRKQLGMLKEGEELAMAVAMLGGYDNFVKALPLDSLPNEKGKIKPKYSKEIKSTIAGHYNDFTDIAATFWNEKDYENAYRGWDIFVELSKNPELYDIKVQPDTVVANFMFNRGLAAWQADDLASATRSFREAIENGYDTPECFQYGMATATGASLNDDLLFFATEGNRLYGKEDNQYINNIINYYLKVEKYDEAIAYLEAAIKENPSVGQYYALEGIIYDNKNDLDKSIELYRKSIELDPTNGLGNFYLGRALLLKAGRMSDNYAGEPMQFDNYKAKTLDPIYREGIEYLENAYKNDPNNRSDILKALDAGYYQLNDAAGMESVNQRKLED